MKLPVSSYKVLRVIILGYLHQGGADRKPASLGDVEKSTGIKTTMVSGNNGALADLGIIHKEGSSGYRLTDAGLDVARALEFEEPQLTRRALGELLSENDTIGQFLNALRVRGPMDTDAATRHLLMSSGQTKSTEKAQTGARALLEMLEAAGLVEMNGDEIRGRSGRARPLDDDVGPEAPGPPASDATAAESGLQPATYDSIVLDGAPGFAIAVEVSLTGEDLSDPERSANIIQAIRSLTSQD